jgi:hypothetical protein
LTCSYPRTANRTVVHSVLRDDLDRASQAFSRSTEEFQAAVQFDSNAPTETERDLRMRQASESHAAAADSLFFALIRFEAFVRGGTE